MAQVMAALAAILYWVESEFLSLVGGACGPNAAAMAESWADQAYHSTRDVFLRFARVGACDKNGISTGGGLVRGLKADGFTVRRQYPVGDWLGFLRSELAKPSAVVTELAAAHNLRDFLTGAGMDAGPGLAYHYITAFLYHPGGHSERAGRDLPEGFWCADGDSDATNPVVGGHRTRVTAGHSLQFYTVTTLRAAQPCDLIAVYPRVKLPTVQPTPVPAPQPAPPVVQPKPTPPAPAPAPAPVSVQPRKAPDMNLFDKANAGLPLTPIQRAFLRFMEGAIVATVVSAMPAIAAAMASTAPDWGNVSRIFVATFAVVLLLSLSKWAKAHGDNQIAQEADTLAQDIEHGLPNNVKVEPSSVPDVPTEPDPVPAVAAA